MKSQTKKKRFQNYAKKRHAQAITVFKSANHGRVQPLAGLRKREIAVHEVKKVIYVKSYHLIT